MSMTMYIYYRVPGAQAAELQEAVQDMQDRLRAAMPGLAASLMRRVDDGAHQPDATWMETYHFNGHADHRAWSALDDALERELAALRPGTMGTRHTERFETLSRAVGLVHGAGRG